MIVPNSAEVQWGQPTTAQNTAEQPGVLEDLTEWVGIGSARKEREFNSAEAQKQRAWEEQMSNTSYQRAVADMRKAGINPIMAFQQGGASTPSGSSANSGSGNSAGANLIGTILTSAIKLLIAKEPKVLIKKKN